MSCCHVLCDPGGSLTFPSVNDRFCEVKYAMNRANLHTCSLCIIPRSFHSDWLILSANQHVCSHHTVSALYNPNEKFDLFRYWRLVEPDPLRVADRVYMPLIEKRLEGNTQDKKRDTQNTQNANSQVRGA